MPPCSERPSSLKRRLRNYNAARTRSLSLTSGLVSTTQRNVWRRATVTPMLFAMSRCVSDAELIRIPFDAQLAGRGHVADERRGGDHGGAGEVAFAAEPHAILPVAIERRDRALPFHQRVRPLPEAGTAPRLANRAADRPEDVGDRAAVEARVAPLDLPADAARALEA